MLVEALLQSGEVPWEKVIAAAAGGGAATLMAITLYFVLKRDDSREERMHAANKERDENAALQHAKCNETIETCTTTFAQTIERVAQRSDERYAQVVREQREAHALREAELLAMLRDRR